MTSRHFRRVLPSAHMAGASKAKGKTQRLDLARTRVRLRPAPGRVELVIITGMSGSGKASVLKVFEDLGYYCVDNLPMDLMPQFAALATNSAEITRTAIVVD